jgi:hypothetical protein
VSDVWGAVHVWNSLAASDVRWSHEAVNFAVVRSSPDLLCGPACYFGQAISGRGCILIDTSPRPLQFLVFLGVRRGLLCQ